MQIGFTLATLMMFALTTLNPDTSYAQEVVIMVLMGMGMGVAMPTLNLAIQNEFEQRQLGVATSSSQLFRSLGSTLGTAIFGALLTAGLISGIGNIQSTPYVQALSNNPQASKVGDLADANTILNLNMPSIKNEITAAANDKFDTLPAATAGPAKEQFATNQKAFSDTVVQAFSDSLHRIFIVAAFLMTAATALVYLLKERPLKSAKPTDTPGEL